MDIGESLIKEISLIIRKKIKTSSFYFVARSKVKNPSHYTKGIKPGQGLGLR